ncbi:MAG: DUF5668 domain-containing protein [Chloroflexota bacterium]
MHVHRGFLNWGVFLICLGAVPLAVQLNVIDSATASSLLRLWPLILIGIGLGLLLRFSRFQALGGFIVAGTLGILVGTFFAAGFPSFSSACNGDNARGAAVTRDGTLQDPADVSIEITCADLALTRAPTNSWSVEVTSPAAPVIEAIEAGRLALASGGHDDFLPFGRAPENWRVSLPAPLGTTYVTLNASRATLSLGEGLVLLFSGTLNASDARVDLGSADLTHGPLNLVLNASTARVILPSGGMGATSSIDLNASSLDLCAAPDLGLRITYDDTLSSQNFASAGLAQSGKMWQSANYTTATAKADLHISANVSTTTLNPAGGCQ